MGFSGSGWGFSAPAPGADGNTKAYADAVCQASDAVEDFVYISGDKVGDKLTVTKCVITSLDTMPAYGVIVSKSSATECRVQWLGHVEGLFSGLSAGSAYFLGTDARIHATPPSVGAPHYLQIAGIAIDASVLLLTPDFGMVKKLM